MSLNLFNCLIEKVDEKGITIFRLIEEESSLEL